VPSQLDPPFPVGNPDEREMLLSWLAFLRGAVLRKISGLTDEDARWTPDGQLISLLGIVNHLTNLEWRWIDGVMRGEATSRSNEEFYPGGEVTVESAIDAYAIRASATDAYIRATPLITPCNAGGPTDLRFVVLHMINETARHAGHADAARELLDGVVGE
jgi:uncharacterized damage-inducible protein DinB